MYRIDDIKGDIDRVTANSENIDAMMRTLRFRYYVTFTVSVAVCILLHVDLVSRVMGNESLTQILSPIILIIIFTPLAAFYWYYKSAEALENLQEMVREYDWSKIASSISDSPTEIDVSESLRLINDEMETRKEYVSFVGNKFIIVGSVVLLAVSMFALVWLKLDSENVPILLSRLSPRAVCFFVTFGLSGMFLVLAIFTRYYAKQVYAVDGMITELGKIFIQTSLTSRNKSQGLGV